ncbi:MAG: hypothetical protein A3A90_02160 [Candidatus Zambryskibacteria bacterium RIFCSPLOWO2_01_FULL_35_19]|uniref:Uncharacterized protein n=1 Tax=Candidatus Zambryskibacteria bacterium RIFCSPLOWO2_01_FULL_35_19 TaxID=1802757 RepID=A0A1G2TYE3_9BACT|nr:MAG: hypothetical protein A3A90_02160 [Candidatus Zambryskibacteria bacterium RIFCSPLOWO2_01_FULL_35_19]
MEFLFKREKDYFLLFLATFFFFATFLTAFLFAGFFLAAFFLFAAILFMSRRAGLNYFFKRALFKIL